MKVLVFGYSDQVDRYSFIATNLLKDYHHEVLTVNPRFSEELTRLDEDFHTLTLYVNPTLSDKFQDLLLKAKPQRVIFNPGTENPTLIKKFQDQKADVVIGCTLVMLRTNQF